jgi:hypothetical protein
VITSGTYSYFANLITKNFFISLDTRTHCNVLSENVERDRGYKNEMVCRILYTLSEELRE